MRIETPADRKMRKNRTAMLLTERQEEIQKKAMEDVMGNPEAWDAAYKRAMARRNQEIWRQEKAMAIVIPETALKPSTEKAEDNSIGGLKDSTVNFLNGFGVGALFMTVTVLVMIALYFLS